MKKHLVSKSRAAQMTGIHLSAISRWAKTGRITEYYEIGPKNARKTPWVCLEEVRHYNKYQRYSRRETTRLFQKVCQ